MAFFRRRKIRFFLTVILIMAIFVTLFAAFYLFCKTRIEKAMETYEKELEQLEFDLYSLSRQVYVPKQDIPCGTVLTKDMFDIVEMKLQISQSDLVDETDMGKVSTVFLPSGTPVLKFSVADEKLPDDIREQEFNMFLLKTNQKKGDFIDVRIIFPNGENYIVLSKKQIKDIIPEENIIRLWLSETEIHNISSAIIDAYIHPGTKIYVTTYIIPELQGASVPFYAANDAVLDLIQKDPNILEKASDVLSREIRAELEKKLNSIAEENISRVTTGVNEEISKNNEVIKSMEANPVENSEDITNGENSEPQETEIFN